MNLVKKTASALAVLSLLVAPVVAGAAAPVRASAPITDESELRGGRGGGTILLIAVAAGMIYTIYELISGDDDDDDNPVSV